MKNKLNLIAISCLAMVLARMLYAENIKLIFLIWNLFLAWIPYYTSSYLDERKKELNLFKTISLFVISISFLPNAVYLITDLIHLKPRTGIPLWYDAMILFCFSLLGLIYNTITLINIERIVKLYLPIKWVILFMCLLITASGFGIYLGRELRWNSWDLLIHPFQIFMDTIKCIVFPFENTTAWYMTFTFGFIQFLFWYVFRNSSTTIK
jgi:uncharacterized membrane protein